MKRIDVALAIMGAAVLLGFLLWFLTGTPNHFTFGFAVSGFIYLLIDKLNLRRT